MIIVISLELDWSCRQREGSVQPEHLHSWVIIFKWPVAMEHIQISIRKGKSWAPTWGRRAGLIPLHKVVVVCDGVTVFEHISYVLVTLKEQSFVTNGGLPHTCRAHLHSPRRLWHTALTDGCSEPKSRSSGCWFGPLLVAEISMEQQFDTI